MAPMTLVLLACMMLTLVSLGLAIIAWFSARRSQLLCAQLKRQLAAVNSSSVGMGQRILSLEKRLNAQPTPAAGATAEDHPAYSQAARLLELGLDTDEVARRCGLSQSEVSLLKAVSNH